MLNDPLESLSETWSDILNPLEFAGLSWLELKVISNSPSLKMISWTNFLPFSSLVESICLAVIHIKSDLSHI